jgi:hypothetical protein
MAPSTGLRHLRLQMQWNRDLEAAARHEAYNRHACHTATPRTRASRCLGWPLRQVRRCLMAGDRRRPLAVLRCALSVPPSRCATEGLANATLEKDYVHLCTNLVFRVPHLGH